MVVPGGEERIRPGDRVVVIGSPAAARAWSRVVSRDQERVDEAVIFGAGMMGTTIASVLLERGIRVRVVDSRSVTMGLGMIAVSAARLAGTGSDVDAVAESAAGQVPRTRVYGALDTLENLKKGGRVGGTRALVGSLLSIKPVIEVRDGRVEPESRQRTRARSLTHLVEKVQQQPSVENLAIMHADADDVGELVDRLGASYDGEILVGDIGPVIGTHSGRGAIGVVFQVPR